MNTPKSKPLGWMAMDGSSISLRFVAVAALIALLTIPLGFVGWVVDDRHQHYQAAVDDVSRAWGGRQRLAGPMILIPVDPSDSKAGQPRYLAVMPKTLEIDLNASHTMRRRGIFETPVFDLKVTATGVFPPLDLATLDARFGPLRPGRAVLALGVSDPRGIRAAELTWRGDPLALGAVSELGPIRGGLGGALADVAPGGRFAIALDVRGAGRIATVPVGDRSTVTIRSTWPHPSFNGRFLPDHHQIGADGFTATWTAHHLARGFPGSGLVTTAGGNFFAGKDVGFSAFEPVNLYSSVTRSVKYGVLFVVLTLVGVLCLELLTNRRFHFVQYGVTGIALVLFFLTLLALAEHIGFTLGYAAAAALLAGMIAWYAHGATGSAGFAATTAVVLVKLYAVLYVLLRLESFALLVGVAVLLLALVMLMLATRKLTPPLEQDSQPSAPAADR